jgi:Flp pilus assembly protein TadB
MVRKTREQVWRELDSIGEDEVRRRLAAKPTEVEEPGLIREWLEQRDRVNTALADTSREVAARQRGLSKNVKRAIGSAALIGVAAIALGFLLARRKR